MSGSTTTVMDPNTILPSPPSSTCSSLDSRPSSPISRPFSRRGSKSATELPFSDVRRILGYVQEELEGISYAILEGSNPGLLEAKGIDCADGVELNWACRHLPPHCPASMSETLNDWLPDIRHAYVHRYKFSALAVCKTVYEAAVFAKSVGYEALGRRIEDIAAEMDWCRVEMEKRSGDLPGEEEVKKMVSGRLQGVLKASRKEMGWEVKDGWEVSAAVREYTFEQKLEENAWADPRAWGQDRNRRYRDASASSGSRATPVRRPSVVDNVGSWRSSLPGCGSSTTPTSGSSVASSPSRPTAQTGSASSPARLSPGDSEGNFWGSSTSVKAASASAERPSAQRTSNSPPTGLSSGVEKGVSWRSSASGNLLSGNSTPSRSVPSSEEKPSAQSTSKAYVPPAKRGGSAPSWTRKR